MNQPTNYPLSWPVGWARTPAAKRAGGRFQRALGASLNLLETELRRLGGTDLVISTNLQPRLDGRPYADPRSVADPGVALYFRLRGAPRVLACDRWSSVGANVAAIAKHIEALRGQERWGVGSLEQAFAGYAALPAPACDWRAVLGLTDGATLRQVHDRYRELAKSVHPDVGGDVSQLQRLNAAWEVAQSELAGGANG